MTGASAIYRSFVNELFPNLGCIIPIFVVQNGRFAQDRTGVLIAIGAERFLVTAAHHLEHLDCDRDSLALAPSINGDPAVPVHSTFHILPAVDIAITQLDADVVQKIEKGRNFLRVTDIDTGTTRTEGIYLVAGYPLLPGHSEVDSNRQIAKAKPLIFCSTLYSGKPDIFSSYNSDHNFLLEYYREGYAGEVIRKTPSLEGVSGGVVWRLATNEELRTKTHSKSRSRVCGIQIAQKPGNYLMAVSMSTVFDIIIEHYAAAKHALNFYWPA